MVLYVMTNTHLDPISLNSSENEKCFRKNCKVNKNTHVVMRDFFFEYRAVYQIIWKTIVQRGRPRMTIWLKRITCWIPKATHSLKYVKYFMFFHCNKGCTKAPQCNVIRSTLFLLSLILFVNIYLMTCRWVVSSLCHFCSDFQLIYN